MGTVYFIPPPTLDSTIFTESLFTWKEKRDAKFSWKPRADHPIGKPSSRQKPKQRQVTVDEEARLAPPSDAGF